MQQRKAIYILCTMLIAFILAPRFISATSSGGLSDGSSSVTGTPETGMLDDMEPLIRKRIANLVTIVEPVYNPYVRSYLNTYIERSPEKTQEILGRTQIYFPLFEKVLSEFGLPEELKFLAIIESALLQEVKSRVGAAGLWQFMPPTGRYYGLSISKYVDERMDPEKATRSAVRYLKYLYERFDSWELAMAAYNAGPGRVNRAIRLSGTHDYWELAKFLPRETRAYVPGFIAAMYVYHHHENHGLQLAEPTDDFIYTSKVRIHKGMSFQQISEITGVTLSYLKTMNAKFVRNYVPSSTQGYDILLPSYASEYLLQYLDRPDAVAIPYKNFNPILVNGATYEERESVFTYYIEKGDNLYNLARENNCSVSDLKAWNGLQNNNIQIGQPLKIYFREMVLVQPKRRPVYTVSPLTREARVEAGSSRGQAWLRGTPEPNYLEDEQKVIVRRRHSIRTQLMIDRIPPFDHVRKQPVSGGKVVTIE